MKIVDHVLDWARARLFDLIIMNYVALRRDNQGSRFLDLDGWRMGLMVGDRVVYLLVSPFGAEESHYSEARLGEIVGMVAGRLGAPPLFTLVSIDECRCFIWNMDRGPDGRELGEGVPGETVRVVREAMTSARVNVHRGRA